jgi:hypothetical protein
MTGNQKQNKDREQLFHLHSGSVNLIKLISH